MTAAVSVMYSCKKDETTSPTNGEKETSTFNPNTIEDMNVYLSNFIKTMKTPTKDNEQMSLENAEWHLTASLNYQLCNANTGRTNMLYDTIYTTIAVNDNNISMSEINSSFQEISAEVSNIYDSYNMPNKQIVFIHSEIDAENISDNEATVRSVMAITERNDHYYFDNFEFLLFAWQIFDKPDGHLWNKGAIDSLNYYIDYIGAIDYGSDYYYVSMRDITYSYQNYPINDPTSVYPYRLYYCGHCLQNEATLTGVDLAFFLDSYLGLVSDSHYGSMMKAYVSPDIDTSRVEEGARLSHVLHVKYGRPISNGQIQN